MASTWHVLVVDDEPGVRRTIALGFQLEGWAVSTATDGADAIVQVQLANPDLVVMDIMMPRLDGLTALGHLRRQASTADLPVVLVSARAESTDVAIGLRAGADDYVTKPFDLDDLVARSQRILELPAGQRPHRRTGEAAGQSGPADRALIASSGPGERHAAPRGGPLRPVGPAGGGDPTPVDRPGAALPAPAVPAWRASAAIAGALTVLFGGLTVGLRAAGYLPADWVMGLVELGLLLVAVLAGRTAAGRATSGRPVAGSKG